MWCENGLDCGACGCGEEPPVVEVSESNKKGFFFKRNNVPGSIDDRNDNSSTKRKSKRFRFLRRKSKASGVALNGNESISGLSMSSGKKRRWFKQKTKMESVLDGEKSDDARSVKSVSSTRSFLSAKLSNPFADTQQRRVVYRTFGPNPKEQLGVEIEDEMPIPEGPDHVVIKVVASTVSLDDCILRRGFCDDIADPVSLPVTPGGDVIGNIVTLGSEVSNLKRGDRVAALVRTGGNSRFISVPSKSLVSVPKGLDAAEAVTMVATYAAAYQSLRLVSDNNAVFSMQGKKVLVVGGMQSVGHALIELCTKAQAKIFATAPDSRHSYIRNALEATPLPENSRAWSAFVDGEMDYVFDGVCQDGLEAGLRALKPDGKLVCFGQSAVLREEVGVFGTPFSVRYNKLRSSMISGGRTLDLWSSFKSNPTAYKKNLQALFQLLKWHKIKPIIAKKVTLSEVATVHARLENGDCKGTVVCHPWMRRNSKKKLIKHGGDDEARE